VTCFPVERLSFRPMAMMFLRSLVLPRLLAPVMLRQRSASHLVPEVEHVEELKPRRATTAAGLLRTSTLLSQSDPRLIPALPNSGELASLVQACAAGLQKRNAALHLQPATQLVRREKSEGHEKSYSKRAESSLSDALLLA